MSTGNVRHEFGTTPAGQELLLLFGAKRSPQDELQRAKAHEIKELEQDKSEPQSQVSNLEHDLESNLIAKGKLEQDKSVLQLEVLSLKDNLDSIQEGKEGLEQKTSELQSTVSNLRLGGIILGEKSVDSGNGDVVGWAIHEPGTDKIPCKHRE